VKKVYNKLVRDRIPEIITADGCRAETRILGDDADFAKALDDKIGEEYQEFLNNPSLEELADMEETILARADTLGGRRELERIRLEKAKARGDFAGRIFLEYVDDPDKPES
jgi:predicted house-cleaning noncanonical NTP pyrophosphatase (MazG superfamily)